MTVNQSRHSVTPVQYRLSHAGGPLMKRNAKESNNSTFFWLNLAA